MEKAVCRQAAGPHAHVSVTNGPPGLEDKEKTMTSLGEAGCKPKQESRAGRREKAR